MGKNGVSTLGLLGIMFVGLKLAEIINWSWWWVTLPFWGGIGIVLSVAVIAAIALGLLILLGKA